MTPLALIAVLTSGGLPAVAAVPERPALQRASCWDAGATPTVEEQRLITEQPDGQPSVGARILRVSGTDSAPTSFAAALCGTRSVDQALSVTRRHAIDLWERSVRRAQTRGRVFGALPGNDDRPLYWARLNMTLLLRTFDPRRYPLDGAQRRQLEEVLELGSRGMLTADFSPSMRGNTKVFVSGFDPFTLDPEPRRSNPSGVAALTLDGQRFATQSGVVEVQSVIFPVRWEDFDEGMVERVFTPVFSTSRIHGADLYATVSQGRPGAFDLEVHNGRRRSSTADDNLNRWGGGTRTEPLAFPGVSDGPEFIDTTLPVERMRERVSGPQPVRVNTSVTEIPAGQTEPVDRPDGPTPGSVAVNGGGGGYLSNEIAYRACLLRSQLRPTMAGGHIHTPTLPYPDDPDLLVDAALDQARTAIADQVRRLVLAAATQPE